MKIIRTLLLCVYTMTIISCSHSMADLDKFFQDSKLIPPKQIEPLPEIDSPEIFVYVADELRDPFSNDLQMLAEHTPDNVNVVEGEGPDLNRRKELLENFPLDGLYMVGTYQQEGFYWGIIEDPEGVIHKVLIGEYMGQNFGSISSINEDEITVSEWISDGLGGWTKREASIALREE